MSLNRGELVSEIASQMVRDDLDTRIAIWLSWGLTRIDRFADLKGLGKHVKAACVANQSEYAFPTDCKYIRTFTLLDHIITTFATTDVNITTDVLTVDEDISTGTRLIFLNSDPPGGLSTGTTYYCINLTSTTIQVATSSDNASNGTAISLTDTGSGTHVMQILNSSNSRILRYIPEKEFVSQIPDITQLGTGKAEFYIDRADIFELGKSPDKRYCMDMWYMKWQDEMTDDADEPEVSQIDDLIVAATVDRMRPDYAPKGKAFASGGFNSANINAEQYKYPFVTGK